jgi:hypothetical protein
MYSGMGFSPVENESIWDKVFDAGKDVLTSVLTPNRTTTQQAGVIGSGSNSIGSGTLITLAGIALIAYAVTRKGKRRR